MRISREYKYNFLNELAELNDKVNTFFPIFVLPPAKQFLFTVKLKINTNFVSDIENALHQENIYK